MNLERLNFLFKAAGITKKELAELLDINAQSIYAWESTQNAPYWIWSWLENYAKAKMFDRIMELGKELENTQRVNVKKADDLGNQRMNTLKRIVMPSTLAPGN